MWENFDDGGLGNTMEEVIVILIRLGSVKA